MDGPEIRRVIMDYRAIEEQAEILHSCVVPTERIGEKIFPLEEQAKIIYDMIEKYRKQNPLAAEAMKQELKMYEIECELYM